MVENGVGNSSITVQSKPVRMGEQGAFCVHVCNSLHHYLLSLVMFFFQGREKRERGREGGREREMCVCV